MGEKLIHLAVRSFSMYTLVPLLTAFDKMEIYSKEEKLTLEEVKKYNGLTSKWQMTTSKTTMLLLGKSVHFEDNLMFH